MLTSEISGSYDDDAAQRIIRAGDLRTRFRTQYQTLVGYRDGPLEARGKPRRWTNYIVPDLTAVSWFPQAVVQLVKLIKDDRPDVIVTTSAPESSHLLGLVASAAGIRWVADYRDDWLRDVRHPAPLRAIIRALERQIARRSTVVTAVNDAITADVERRHGVRAFTISNGFDRTVLADCVRRERDSRREPLLARLHRTARDRRRPAAGGQSRQGRADVSRRASTLVARPSPSATRLELVVACNRSATASTKCSHKARFATSYECSELPPRARALGCQQYAEAAPADSARRPCDDREGLRVPRSRKPIFAVTEHNGVAAELLRAAGEHTVAEAGDSESLATALQAYFSRWTGVANEPRSGFDLDAYEYETLGQKLL